MCPKPRQTFPADGKGLWARGPRPGRELDPVGGIVHVKGDSLLRNSPCEFCRVFWQPVTEERPERLRHVPFALTHPPTSRSCFVSMSRVNCASTCPASGPPLSNTPSSTFSRKAFSVRFADVSS